MNPSRFCLDGYDQTFTFSISSIVVSLSLPVVDNSPFLVLEEASEVDVTDTDDTEK